MPRPEKLQESAEQRAEMSRGRQQPEAAKKHSATYHKQIATPQDGKSASGFDRGERFPAACRAISHRNGCPARTSMALPMPSTVSETTSCTLPAKQLVNGQSSNFEKPSNYGYMVVDLERGQRGLQAELSTVLSEPITTHVSLRSGTPSSEKSSYTSPR